MSGDTIEKWATAATWVAAVSAMIAAGTGIWSVWWQFRGKTDRFNVGLDTVFPSLDRETMLHVVNLSDHAVKLKDWGFIEADGRLFSLPLAWEEASLLDQDLKTRGTAELAKRNDTYEVGYVRDEQPVGAYAISVTQKRPRLYFGSALPYRRRLWIRLVIRWRRWFRPRSIYA